VYWFRRPPYLRWLAAGVALLVGLFIDTRAAPTVQYPFAETAIAAGTTIENSITWREIPAGVLPEWPGNVTGVSAMDIAANDPLLPSLVGETVVPADWWGVSLPLPAPIAPGTRIRAVLLDGTVVEGVAIDGALDSGYEVTATVAFPASEAPLVAAAAANDALVVMVAAGTTISGSTG